MSDQLLTAIRGRGQKQTEFGYGILTADRWVRNMQDLAGIDACYSIACRGSTSFNDVLQKASQTLTYSNADMVVEEKSTQVSDGVELPKNTLMVFKHVLTTPRKDRDGDVLRTQGAVVDPKMLLLWQHVHTLPIGKMLSVVEHNEKRLVLLSCIVDINELAHDAAVMVDNDMARFSHGFRALEYEQMKLAEGETTGGGFDIKRFEIMEESMVSVPSNVEAQQQEILLSLVEGGKLTSSIMKEIGKSLREARNVIVPVTDKLVDLEGGLHEDESSSGGGAAAADGGGGVDEDPTACTPEEAEAVPAAEAATEEPAEDKEVKITYQIYVEAKDMLPSDEKAGRVLSARNLAVLQECIDDTDEMLKNGFNMSRGGVAICERVNRKLRTVVESATGGEVEPDKSEPEIELKAAEPTVEEAIGVVLAKADANQVNKLIMLFRTLQNSAKRDERAAKYRELVRPRQ